MAGVKTPAELAMEYALYYPFNDLEQTRVKLTALDRHFAQQKFDQLCKAEPSMAKRCALIDQARETLKIIGVS